MQKCKDCKSSIAVRYNERFDSYYCADCDTWTENICDDEGCWYCVDRPDKPSEIKGELNAMD